MCISLVLGTERLIADKRLATLRFCLLNIIWYNRRIHGAIPW
jgi:hypothetical protein